MSERRKNGTHIKPAHNPSSWKYPKAHQSSANHTKGEIIILRAGVLIILHFHVQKLSNEHYHADLWEELPGIGMTSTLRTRNMVPSSWIMAKRRIKLRRKIQLCLLDRKFRLTFPSGQSRTRKARERLNICRLFIFIWQETLRV